MNKLIESPEDLALAIFLIVAIVAVIAYLVWMNGYIWVIVPK